MSVATALLCLVGCRAELRPSYAEPPDTVWAEARVGGLAVSWVPPPGSIAGTVYVASDPSIGPATIDELGGFARSETSSPIIIGGYPAAPLFVVVTAAYIDGVESGPSPAVAVSPLPEGLLPADAPSWTWQPDQRGSALGSSAAGAGDVDGDGWPDLLLGEQQFTGTFSEQGRVHLLLGGDGGFTPTWDSIGGDFDSHLGRSVASGDIDGDGARDLVAGAPDTPSQTGQVLVFPTSGGAVGAPDSLSTGADSGLYGHAVLVADLDADGYDDVVVGAPQHDSGLMSPNEDGRVMIYRGGPNGVATAASDVLSRATQSVFGASLGRSMSFGDVNGDQVLDLLVGAEDETNTLSTEGAVHVYFGRTDGTFVDAPDFSAFGGDTNADLGRAVACGDFNADGYDDVAVSMPLYLSANAGRLLVFCGSPTGPQSTPCWIYDGVNDDAQLGRRLVAADLDTDGRDDLVVLDDEGRVVWFRQGPAGLPNEPTWEVFVAGAVALSVSEMNRDLSPELLIGAEHSAALLARRYARGRALVWPGPPGRGPAITLQASASAASVSLPGSGFVSPHGPHTCTVDWGDGATARFDDCAPDDLDGAGHVYGATGRYVVRARVVDGLGFFGEAVTTVRIQ